MNMKVSTTKFTWNHSLCSPAVDLSDYYTKSQTDDLISEKVDKIDGMGLSENNFTDAEKSKLAGLENTLSTVNDRLTTLESGSTGNSNNIVVLSQSGYDALSTKVPDTISLSTT